MSAELRDFRGKITTETWCWLEACSRASGDDQSAIVRDVLHRWASHQLSAATIATKLLAAEGIVGNIRESSGRARK